MTTRRGGYFHSPPCAAFHGSRQEFDAFRPDLTRYEDQALCLSASPLVAGIYGDHIYACVVSNICLRRIAVSDWFQMSAARFKHHLHSKFDGFLILPPSDWQGEEPTATFCAETMVLWNISKCRVLGFVRISESLSSEGLASFLAGPSLERQTAFQPRMRFSDRVEQVPQASAIAELDCYLARNSHWGAHARLRIVERRWISERGKPVSFFPSSSQSTWALVTDLLLAAREAGCEQTLSKHLVGAILQLRYPGLPIASNNATPADAQLGRAGDYQVGDTAFHITVSPMPSAMERCRQNLGAGLQAYLLVPQAKLEAARQMADDLAARIAIIAIEAFVAQNIDEVGEFKGSRRLVDFARLLEIYNTRVDAVENDKSHMIEIPANLARTSR